MACDNEYKHVSLKDLQNYFKKSDYFGNLTDEELKLIQKNLGISTGSDLNPSVILTTYEEVYNLKTQQQLKTSNIYVIQDFQSIYQASDGSICGTAKFLPSTVYWLFVRPTSNSTLDPRVAMYCPTIANVSKWTAEYDITPVQFADGTTSKGTITYLKDHNNNIAYYDFKNIRWYRSLEDLNKGPVSYTQATHCFTFDNGGGDASSASCKNNHLAIGAIRNVFMGDTQNVTLAADSHDNTFFKGCENSTFDYGTYNNYFTKQVSMCKGSVHDKTLGEEIAMTCPKQFNVLNENQVLVYLDPQTETFQIKKL